MDYELIFWIVGGIPAIVFFLLCWFYGSQSESILEETQREIEKRENLNKDG